MSSPRSRREATGCDSKQVVSRHPGPGQRIRAGRARSVESALPLPDPQGFSRAASDSVGTSAGFAAPPTPRTTEGSPLQFLRQRQTSGAQSRSAVTAALLSKVPGSWTELEQPVAHWRKYDKAFACEWVSDRLVVLGTKCNTLLLLDVVTSKVQEVLLPRVSAQRTPSGRAVQQSSSGAQVDGQVSPRGPAQSCGIHAVSLSPDGCILATGGANPNDCQVYSVVHTPGAEPGIKLAPCQTLADHADWVFGISWVTTCHLITGSRDRTVKLWQVSDDQSTNTSPLQTCLEKAGKVRDVRYNMFSGRVASLAVDGTLHFWDPHLTSISSVHIGHSQEVVCLGQSDTLMAAGSHSHTTLIDPRIEQPIKDIASLDSEHGVRSVCFRDHLLSAGSGHGKISFYDLRADAYLQLDTPGSGKLPHHDGLTVGKGWLQEDSIYRQYFQEAEHIPNACYAHAWDPTSTKMFCAGGPLAFGLKGSYMGLWA